MSAYLDALEAAIKREGITNPTAELIYYARKLELAHVLERSCDGAHPSCSLMKPARQRCYVHTFTTIDICRCPPDPALSKDSRQES